MSTTNWGKSVVKKIELFFRSIGPGFISGAADDDPSGIAMFSIAGAKFGYGINWLTLLTIPLMIAIQEACARIGITTGRGLAGIIRQHYSKKLLFGIVGLLTVANIINIGADLGMMAAVLQLVAGLPYWFWLILVTVGIVLVEIRIPYQTYEQFLKWLSLLLLVYVVTAFVVRPDWWFVIRSLVFPKIVFSLPFIATVVGFLGTSISPYLFFWQASEEVEEEITSRQIRGFGIGKPKFNGRDINVCVWIL
jgi:NRAMP (natural resistance-associated macrophage protein)-like metal ion transporter